MRRVLAVTASAIALMACLNLADPEVPLYSLLVPNIRHFLELGDTVQFRAVPVDLSLNELTDLRVDLAWSSSNPTVLAIDSDGLASSRAVGTTEIQVTSAGAALSWTLHVVPRIAALDLTPDSVTLVSGDDELFSITPIDAFGRAVSNDPAVLAEMMAAVRWSLADTVVAFLSSPNGPAPYTMITGRGEGETTIVADLEGHRGSAIIRVRLLELTLLSAGGASACALNTDSLPYCWGALLDWQPSRGWWTRRHVPRLIPGTPPLATLSVGGTHACGLSPDGLAYCWGSNQWGALGIGSPEQPAGPRPVAGDLRFATITAGAMHTCGLGAGGEAYCWGATYAVPGGQATEECGTGGKVPSFRPCNRAPALVGDGSLRLTTLSAGGSHTCGLDANRRAYCWGAIGQAAAETPRLVAGAPAFAMLVSGHESACGLAPDGLAFCWGALPDSTPGGNRIVELPISMSNGLRFASLSASRGVDPYRSAGHVCGVTGDGAAYCWGFNNTHQLGVPDTRVHPTPVALPANLRFQAVSAGGNHTCAMSVDRRVYCWGAGDLGQLGVPLDVSSRPERVTGQRP